MLCKQINDSLENGAFRNPSKLAEITPIPKKEDPFDKDNYRLTSILPKIPKVSDKDIYSQVYRYIQQYLNPFLCGFRLAHGAQHALFRLFQGWQKEPHKSSYVGTNLMDFSKAYDYLLHDLIIAKCNTHGFDRISYSIVTFPVESKG